MASSRPLAAEEIEHVEAQAERERAETAKIQAETSEAIANAELAALRAEKAREERKDELAKNERHGVYVFDSEVSPSSVKKCIGQLATWHRQDPGCDIEIHIDSVGGEIFSGFALIDFIRDLRGKGHHVTIVGRGCVASMAAVILQAGDVRALGENALLLLHEGSMGAIGDFGEVEDRVKLMELFHERILALFESRAKPINPKTTKRFIRNRWHRRDWWIASEDALDLGLVDETR